MTKLRNRVLFVVVALMVSLGPIYELKSGAGSYVLLWADCSAIGLLCAIFFFKTEYLFSIRKKSLLIGLLLWVLVALLEFLSSYWAKLPMRAVAGAVSTLLSIPTMILAYHSNRSERILGVLLLSASVVVQLVFVLVQGGDVISTGSYYDQKNELVTQMGGTNYVAGVMCYAAIFIIMNLDGRARALALLPAVGVTLTLSKGGGIILVIFGVISLLVSVNKKIIRRTMFVVTCAVLCIVASILIIQWVYGEGSVDEFHGLILEKKDSLAINGRLELWRVAIDRFLESPLIGNGYDYYDDPHNVILRSLRDFGVFGSVVIAAWLLYPILANVFMAGSVFGLASLAYVAFAFHGLIEPLHLNPTAQQFFGLIYGYTLIQIDENNCMRNSKILDSRQRI